MIIFRRLLLILLLLAAGPGTSPAAAPGAAPPAYPGSGDGDGQTAAQHAVFPRPLGSYGDGALEMGARMASRASSEPFNIAATVIFGGAILHTFMAGFFARRAHRVEERHQERIRREGGTAAGKPYAGARDDVSFRATVLHYLGEVEVIFMLWAIPLLFLALYFFGWGEVRNFVGLDCDFREPLFVVIIMAISASRPVVRFAGQCLGWVANGLGKGSPAAWWLSVLTLAPVMGSLITEPAAMTIGALLLARRFYDRKPGKTFAYATMGLLFVNISVGGVLTNFAAPPVLMVAARWEWSSWFMFSHFGWKAVVAILLSNGLYFVLFRKQLRAMAGQAGADAGNAGPAGWEAREDAIPPAVTLIHLAFLGWTVLTNHYPPLCLGGFLFFVGFMQATGHHQNPLQLRSPLLVGFFLAGLVIHGRCQGWWLEPVLSGGLGETSLLLGAAGLTAFNDNALITFLAGQVPSLPENLKYAIMAGAVAGGGLTVIANAPNPAGQGVLKSYFGGAVNPLGLLLGALAPTVIAIACFKLFS